MKLLNTAHKRKSFAITSVIMAIVIFLLFWVGLSYFDPPFENGIVIQWGDEKSTSEINTAKASSKVKANTTASNQKPNIVEPVITQNNELTIALNQNNAKETPPKKIQEQKPKIDKETNDILNQILNANPSSEEKNAKNNSIQKGLPSGDAYANAFYGTSGSGKSWGLNGRHLLSDGKVVPECNESGIVVVQIEVDRNGNVIKATPGVKGTTNNHPCLLEPALKTALMHKWNTDLKAPERQIGFIEIHFKLGN